MTAHQSVSVKVRGNAGERVTSIRLETSKSLPTAFPVTCYNAYNSYKEEDR